VNNSATARRVLWAAIVAGLLARLVIAFKTYGVPYDTESFEAVRRVLGTRPLDLYSIVNGDPFFRWPYPPAFLPFVTLAGWLSDTTGLPFHGWVQVPQIAADAIIAWLVQHYLGLRGAQERVRLAAAALVALGPSFAIVSGFHGQIDSFAILPAVAALVVWERSAPDLRRAVIAGALIGLGTSVKTVPLLVLFALLPSTRSWRERLALFAPAAAIPLLMLVPFLLATGDDTVNSLRQHKALPGVGGISLLVQPELAGVWLTGSGVSLTSLSRTLLDNQMLLVAAVMAPFAALLAIRRVSPAAAATVLWLVFYVFGVAFVFQYAVWGLPFALMAGYVWQVAAVQAALLVPSVLLYQRGILEDPQQIYVPMMIGVWAFLLVALLRMIAGLVGVREPETA